MHYDLGKETFVVESITDAGAPLPSPLGNASVDTRGDSVRIGINYHFAPRCCEGPLK